MVQRGNVRQVDDQFIAVPSLAGQLFKVGADAAYNFTRIAQDSQKTKVASEVSKAQNELAQYTEQWRVNNQGDPNNEEAIAERDTTYKNIMSKYGENVGTLGQKQFQISSQQVLDSYQSNNNIWQANRNKKNISLNVEDSIRNTMKTIQVQGGNGDLIGATQNAENLYKTLDETLKGSNSFGEIDRQQILKNIPSDSMKAYVSGAINKTPAAAIALLNQEQVVNEIDSLEEVTKLKKAAYTQLQYHYKMQAVNDFVETYGVQNELTNKLISGNAPIAELEDFINSHPNLSEQTKEFLYKQGGFTKADRKKQSKKSAHGVAGGIGEVAERKLSKQEKLAYSFQLENEGAMLLSGIAFENLEDVDIKDVQKNITLGVELESQTMARLQKIQQYQDKLNNAYDKGILTKSNYMELSSKYSNELVKYVGSQVRELETQSNVNESRKFGYYQVKNYSEMIDDKLDFDDEQQQVAEIEKGMLNMYYYNNLQKSATTAGLSSIYELESLPEHTQLSTYNKAFQGAKKQAKENSLNPAMWFQIDYPNENAVISNRLTKKDAEAIRLDLALAIRDDFPDAKEEDVQRLTEKKINEMQGINYQKAQKKSEKNAKMLHNQQDIQTMQNKFKKAGYSDTEINAYLKSKGYN